MDPLGNQPTQPNPQPPVLSPQPAPEVSRSAQVTAPLGPTERPVEAWPPAGTPAAQALNTQPSSPRQVQEVGQEVAEASGAIPVVTPPAPSNSISGFTPPVVPVNQATEPVLPQEPTPAMSNQQADKLFQEEPITKKRNSRKKLKKILLSLIGLVLLGAIASGLYIFVFGSRQAQSYKNSASFTKYQEAFSQIKLSLEKTPIDSAELEAGVNKLKTAAENPGKLSSIVFGDLNPNYKKAKEASLLEGQYKEQANLYIENYGAYVAFISDLSKSMNLISKLEETESIDLKTITSEELDSKMDGLLADCKTSIDSLEESTKPADLANGIKQVSDYLKDICLSSESSLEKAGTVVLNGKTGPISETDQATLLNLITTYNQSSMLLTSGTTPNSDETFEFNKLIAYQRSSLEDAQKLLEQVEAILNS